MQTGRNLYRNRLISKCILPENVIHGIIIKHKSKNHIGSKPNYRITTDGGSFSMAIVKNIPFLIWLYFFLWKMKGIQRTIRRYRAEGNVEKEIAEIRRAEDVWGYSLCKRIGIDLRVKGLENVPDGPVVFVSNHQSYWDIPAFLSAIPGKQIGFIAKTQLTKMPAFGEWIIDIRGVYIQRDDARASLKAFEEAAAYLAQGFSMVIFPEGTRSRKSEIGEFKKGSIRLATKAGVPVVPVSFDGTYRGFEETGVIRAARVDFVIHPAIPTKDMSKKEISELSDVVEDTIRKGFAEILESRKGNS